jgi:hypothetical protein
VVVIFLVQLVPTILLLLKCYVLLVITLVGPIVFNILCAGCSALLLALACINGMQE